MIRSCFLFMAIVFWSNNVVQPFYDYLNIDSVELTKNMDEKKKEKEKEENEPDDFLQSLAHNQSISSGFNRFTEENADRLSHYYIDIITPPPKDS